MTMTRLAYRLLYRLSLSPRTTRTISGRTLARPSSLSPLLHRYCSSEPPSQAQLWPEKAAADYSSQTFTDIIQVLAANQWGANTEAALERLQIPSESRTVDGILLNIISVDTAYCFFQWLQGRRGYKPDIGNYSTMLDILSPSGDSEKMVDLVKEIAESGYDLTCVSYIPLLSRLVKSGKTESAMKLWESLIRETSFPSDPINTFFINVLSEEKFYEEASAVYARTINPDSLPDCAVFTALLRGLGPKAARAVLVKLEKLKIDPEPRAYAHLIETFSKVGDTATAKQLARKMREVYTRPNEIFCHTINSLLKEGIKAEEVEKIAEEIWPELPSEYRIKYISDVCDKAEMLSESSFSSDSTAEKVDLSEIINCLEAWNSLSEPPPSAVLHIEWNNDLINQVLSRINSADLAWKFFCYLKTSLGFLPDVFNHIAMLRILVKNNYLDIAENLLLEMKKAGFDLPIKTFNDLIKDCTVSRSPEAGLQIFAYLKESNLEPNKETFTALIHAFAKGGDSEKAFDLWDLMLRVGFQFDTSTYTTVIHALGLSGYKEKAELVFRQMLASGCQPDENTYTALINCLAHDYAKAKDKWTLMIKSGLNPTAVTNGIMGLAARRAGDILEAEEFESAAKSIYRMQRQQNLMDIHTIFHQNLVEKQPSDSLLF